MYSASSIPPCLSTRAGRRFHSVRVSGIGNHALTHAYSPRHDSSTLPVLGRESSCGCLRVLYAQLVSDQIGDRAQLKRRFGLRKLLVDDLLRERRLSKRRSICPERRRCPLEDRARQMSSGLPPTAGCRNSSAGASGRQQQHVRAAPAAQWSLSQSRLPAQITPLKLEAEAVTTRLRVRLFEGPELAEGLLHLVLVRTRRIDHGHLTSGELSLHQAQVVLYPARRLLPPPRLLARPPARPHPLRTG